MTISKDKRLVMVTSGVDILDIFSYEFIKAFENMGYEVFDFKANEGIDSVRKLIDFVKKPVKAAIFYEQLGLFASVTEGKNLWEQLRIPCIDILMDHPFCFSEDFDRMNPDVIVLCPDRNHMKYLNRFYPKLHTTGFLAHGGIKKSDFPKPIKERKTDVLYAGGISAFSVDKVMPDFSEFTFDAKKVSEDALEDLIANPHKTTEEVIEDSLKDKKLSFSDDELKDIIAQLRSLVL